MGFPAPGSSGSWAGGPSRAGRGPAREAAHPRRAPLTALPWVQLACGAGGRAALHSVLEELVRFRLKVRQFALAGGAATREARRPLLEACDALRQDLAAHGISIKVSHRGRPKVPCKPGGRTRMLSETPLCRGCS